MSPQPTLKPACINCQFWLPFWENSNIPAVPKRGRCHRYPPVLDTRYDTGDDVPWEGPATSRDYWCGEYEAKEPKA